MSQGRHEGELTTHCQRHGESGDVVSIRFLAVLLLDAAEEAGSG